jgi:hypothetical protein
MGDPNTQGQAKWPPDAAESPMIMNFTNGGPV